MGTAARAVPPRMAKYPSPFPRGAYFIVGLTLLGVALGGSTTLQAQGVIAVLAAIIIFFFPPRQTPAPTLVIISGGLLLLALAAFLPAGWGGLPEWHRYLLQELKLPLGPLRTPQPWLTLQACGLLFLGLTWTVYLLSQEWNNMEKSCILRLLVGGVIVLAAISIAAYLGNYHIPGWTQEQNRGWFPNRNQSASVLVIAGTINYVIAFKAAQKKRFSVLFWTLGLVVIGTALIICYSRAGIMLFFTGIALWHFIALFRARQRVILAFGVALMLLLLSLFFLFGGSTLERFLHVSDSIDTHESSYRILIQEDALRVSMQSPLLGTGLGNFEPVFTSMRKFSADQNRTIHPESDWLWMVVEMGWIAPVLILLGLRWWAGRCLPVAYKQGEALRCAAIVAAALFLVHSFVDVGGHRLGSLFVGLLTAAVATAFHPTMPATARTILAFRGLAVLLALLGSWWLASCWTDAVPPTSATLDRIQDRLDQSASAGKLASVAEEANRALAIEPLNWTYYFRRGSAAAFRTGGADDAANDFQIARYLEPNSIDLCVYEGEAWLSAGDATRCLEAWREALRRTKTNGVRIYTALLQVSQENLDVHRGLGDFASKDTDYLITFLDYATPGEETKKIDDLLARDPDLQGLSFDQQKKLFAAWYAHGNRDDLTSLLMSHTQLQLTGWKYLAQHFADQQDFELAAITAMRYLQPPVTQTVPSDQPLSVLESHFYNRPDDVMEGVRLCQAQIRQNDPDGALDTISRLEKQKDCPRYIFYLKAQLCVKKQQWEDAWNALQRLDAN